MRQAHTRCHINEGCRGLALPYACNWVLLAVHVAVAMGCTVVIALFLPRATAGWEAVPQASRI